ncbi:MAG: hypothetical protein M3N02_02835, partial [Pseudomonadota bacterium]|nr:hypothetical protein [Pseudomonadota bacterium]
MRPLTVNRPKRAHYPEMGNQSRAALFQPPMRAAPGHIRAPIFGTLPNSAETCIDANPRPIGPTRHETGVPPSMSLGQDLAPHLPFLRRYARALTGS